jgi:hypothetical protein
MRSAESFVLVDYTLPDGRASAMLIHVEDKDDLAQILETLILVTGKSVNAVG